MKIIERDGKFYLQLTDGEIEMTKDDLEQRKEGAENLKRFAEKSIIYSENNTWTAETIPKEFDSIVKIDLYAENLINAIQQEIKEGKSINDIIYLLDFWIDAEKEKLKNPMLMQSKQLTKYFIEKLKRIKKIISTQQNNILKLEDKSDEKQEKAKQSAKRSYTTKHFVFTYLLDCKALNRPLYEGVKNDFLTGFASSWIKFLEETKAKATTFNRLFYQYENETLTENNLNNLMGEDWQSIVLELSDDPQTLKIYLEHQYVKVRK